MRMESKKKQIIKRGKNFTIFRLFPREVKKKVSGTSARCEQNERNSVWAMRKQNIGIKCG